MFFLKEIEKNIQDNMIKKSKLDQLLEDIDLDEEEYEDVLLELLDRNINIVEIDEENEEQNLDMDSYPEIYNEDMVTQYFNSLSQNPPLDPNKEKELLIKYKKGDLEAKEKLILSNLRLVAKIALEYINPNYFFLDLVQDGTIGLIKGIEKFEVDKGFRLSTYVIWWIRKEIIDSLKEKINAVKIPNHIFLEYKKIKVEEEKIEQEKGRKAKNSEIAEALDMNLEKILQIKKIVNSNTMALDDDSQEGRKFELKDETTQDQIESDIEDEARHTRICDMLKILTKRERIIIEKYFGLSNSGQKYTYVKIGEELNLSAERIRVLKERALRKLKFYGADITNG
ncbi:MAG: sigma-70 family RNA polymerase sigma factor [Fusobacteriota bacterium]